MPRMNADRVNRLRRATKLIAPNADESVGFSLVELLLVIGLIAVLVAIALPLYENYRLKVQDHQAEQDIIAMSMQVTNFWQNNRAYPASLADIGMAGKLDPWGRPYIYYDVAANGKGGARKDKALNPLNTDFDLYSLGPDGQSKLQITQKASLDDIIRANDGTFVGVAADY